LKQQTIDQKNKLREFLQSHPNTTYNSQSLATATGYPTKKTCVELRKALAELIDEGIPIISDDNGYKLTTDKDEIWKCIKSLEKRQQGISRRIKSLREHI
jgi:biotin operon repressor